MFESQKFSENLKDCVRGETSLKRGKFWFFLKKNLSEVCILVRKF